MDKEKEIKKIAGLIDDDISPELKADRLLDAGYGNVRQAVKEFAEKLKEMFGQSMQYGTVRRCVDQLFTEFYGDNK